MLTGEEREPYLARDKIRVIDDFCGEYDYDLDIWNIDRLLLAQECQTLKEVYAYFKKEGYLCERCGTLVLSKAQWDSIKSGQLTEVEG